jgi:hypothetical protein
MPLSFSFIVFYFPCFEFAHAGWRLHMKKVPKRRTRRRSLRLSINFSAIAGSAISTISSTVAIFF